MRNPVPPTSSPTVYRDRCRHFTGIKDKCCGAGVPYASVEMTSEKRPRVRLPCADFGMRDHDGNDVRVPDTCPERSFLTQEEHAASEEQFRAAAAHALMTIAAGKCHICGAAIEPSKVVGRCKYGACGHRIGQVGGTHG